MKQKKYFAILILSLFVSVLYAKPKPDYELVKDNKVLAKIDANGQIGTYLYSTGEPLMSFNSSNNLSEILFKDGTVLFKSDGTNFTLNYKDGKPLYEAKGENWKFFSNDGEEIISNFDNITDIKKLD